MRVLSVEDDTDQRILVERSLRNVGFVVDSCSHFAEAMKLIAEFDYAVAIVELSLENEDGMTLVAEIARCKPKTKIVIHAANASFESILDRLELRVHAYIEKSRSIAYLVEQVRRASSDHLLDSLNAMKRESHLQIRMLDAVCAGAIATDGEFRIIYLNSVARVFLDISEHHALGLDALEMFAKSNHSGFSRLTEIRSRLTNLVQEAKWEGNVQLAAPSDSHSSHDISDTYEQAACFRLSISPIFETAETCRGYIFIFSDVSEQRRVSLELERSRQSLLHLQRIATIGQIANVLAHEINQSLSAISNYSGALLHGLKNEELPFDKLVEGLDLIQEQSIRAGEIVGQLRTSVSPKNGPLQVCDLNVLIQETLRLIEPVLRDHRVKLELALANTLLPVNVDRIQLSQVLVNILKSAAVSMESLHTENRACCVSTSCSGNEVQVRIQDCGPGLSQQEIEALFVPSLSNKKGGLGLGLCISHSIMKEHHGSMVVENGPTGGLVVDLRLPVTTNPLTD